LERANVNILTSATIVEFTEDGVVIERDGQRERISGFDTVVLALGVEPINEASKVLRDIAAEVYVIGDADNPGRARDAISAGYELGQLI
jgi:hypothetical protein